MIKATIQEAEGHLAELVAKAQQGEEVVLTVDDKPAVRITPLEAQPRRRQLGHMKGVFEVGPEFFEPMTEEELKGWGY